MHECFNNLNFISQPYCYICGFAFEFQIKGQVNCGKCVEKPPHFNKARSLLKFDEKCKKLIHSFKYNDLTAALKFLLISYYSKLT